MTAQPKSISGTDTSEISASLRDARNDLSDQIETLKSDFASLAQTVSGLATSGAESVKAEAANRARKAGEAGDAAAHAALAQVEERGAELADYARRKPLVALAAAAGAGLIIGYLTAPRK